MFILSKLFWMVFQPLVFAWLCVLLSMLLLIGGRTNFSLFFTGLALIVLFVTFFTTTGAMLMASLENRFTRILPETPPVCAIVLGGGINTGHSARRGTYVFTRAADRYIEALRLAKLYPNMRILITGGDNALGGNRHGEAEPAALFFTDQGLERTRLILDPKARNTAENAQNSAGLLEQNGIDGPCLLITSAYHLPRSVALFERHTRTVIPWPADYRTGGSTDFRLQFDRPTSNATMLSTAIREWSGLIAYRLIGKTKVFLPKGNRLPEN